MISTDDILNSIKHQVRDFSQEKRIRELYDRTYAAYQTDRTQGIKGELESDRTKLRTKFDTAIEKVKRDTGLF